LVALRSGSSENLGVYGYFAYRDSIPFVVVCRFRAPLQSAYNFRGGDGMGR
jgi:hypothetical protein